MKKQEKICRYRQQRNSELNEIRMKKMEEKIINNERIMAVMNKYALMLTSEDNEISRYNIIAQRKAELSALQCDHVKRITELEREYISLQNEIDRVCLEMEDDEPAPPPLQKRSRISNNLPYGWTAAVTRRRSRCGESSTSCPTQRVRTYPSISRSTVRAASGGWC